jgi:hypothetical protein
VSETSSKKLSSLEELSTKAISSLLEVFQTKSREPDFSSEVSSKSKEKSK